MTDITSIKKLSNLAAKNKIIPFLGAGSSYGHLHLDWDVISKEMANILGINGKNNIQIAEEYEKKFNKDGLSDFLKKKLIITEYDEDLDIVPLIVISLGIGVIYTTNQDNVFEKCIEKYGRRYRIVSILEDLAAYLPGESIYIKYHGSLDHPETIIFSKSSYKDRIVDNKHFLNIRMRSDLLTKSFLFIGYSFRDPNINILFEELSTAFGGKLPQSYLIAFNYTVELELLNKKYGMEIIDPYKEIATCTDNSEAFEKYLTIFCEETYSKKAEMELKALFHADIPHAQRVVSKYEISSLKSVLVEKSFEELIKIFRETFDLSLIPDRYFNDVVEIYTYLCKKCSNREQSDALLGAAFNLRIKTLPAIEILSCLLTTSLYRGHYNGLDIFHPNIPNLNSAAYPIVAARAIELIAKWDLVMNDSFWCHVTNWIKGYNTLPENIQSYIKTQIDFAWKKCTKFENPIKYWERLGHKSLFGISRTFESLSKDLINLFPHKFVKPYEE